MKCQKALSVQTFHQETTGSGQGEKISQELDKEVSKVEEAGSSSEEKPNTMEGKVQLPSEEWCLQTAVVWLARPSEVNREEHLSITHLHFPSQPLPLSVST